MTKLTSSCHPMQPSPFPIQSNSLISKATRAKSAFSLVEVVLALGICSFAMIAIVGMIPMGLTTFRSAMNTTAQSQIVQRIAGDLLLSEYQNLDSKVYYYNE